MKYFMDFFVYTYYCSVPQFELKANSDSKCNNFRAKLFFDCLQHTFLV